MSSSVHPQILSPQNKSNSWLPSAAISFHFKGTSDSEGEEKAEIYSSQYKTPISISIKEKVNEMPPCYIFSLLPIFL